MAVSFPTKLGITSIASDVSMEKHTFTEKGRRVTECLIVLEPGMI